MKTDRELLELAAKAAGIVGNWVEKHPEDGHPTYSSGIGLARMIIPLWNPLTDDGDALRLAAKTGLRVDFNYRTGADERPGVAAWTPGDKEPYPPFWTVDARDHNAAARQTIVRAAAAIGEAIP